MQNSAQKLFGKQSKILIGMIHLPSLLSTSRFSNMEDVLSKAIKDLDALESAGFDGALIENYNDRPLTEFANEAQISCMTVIAAEIMKRARIKVGVQMMLNDWKASFAISAAVGAHFTRLDVFVDNVSAECGEIRPVPADIMAYKRSIAPNVVLLTDIHVKHKIMLDSSTLEESALRAIEEGSDGLIITGEATGQETPVENVRRIREQYPDACVFIGAGVNESNAAEQLSIAHGAIVGTSIKSGDHVDADKAKTLASMVRDLK